MSVPNVITALAQGSVGLLNVTVNVYVTDASGLTLAFNATGSQHVIVTSTIEPCKPESEVSNVTTPEPELKAVIHGVEFASGDMLHIAGKHYNGGSK
jgi:hypothetical protein